MSNQFLPESMYQVDTKMSYETLLYSFENNLAITGRITRLNSKDKTFEVYLGGNFNGIIHFEDATIYSVYFEDGNITPNIFNLTGKIIRAKIIHIDDNGTIFLSRKENMYEALDFLKDKKEIQYASITGFSVLSAFIDIGAGITGRSYSFTFARVKFKNIKDIGLKIGDIISVKILSFLDESSYFELSRVDALPSHYDVINPRDFVTCKIFDPVRDENEDGYYALIDGKFCGIVDSPDMHLNYGDTVVAYVKKLKDTGVKMNMVKKL